MVISDSVIVKAGNPGHVVVVVSTSSLPFGWDLKKQKEIVR